MNDEMIFHIEAGWTSHRPIRPDEHHSTFIIAARTEQDAHLIAAQWTLAHPGAVMPTSTRTLLAEA